MNGGGLGNLVGGILLWGILLVWVVIRVVVLMVWRVLVGQQQVHLPFNSCKISLDLFDPVVHLVETPSNLFLERSLKLSGDSEDYLIC